MTRASSRFAFAAAVALVALAASPAFAQGRPISSSDNALRFWVSSFELDGESEYWDGTEDVFGLTGSDLENGAFGIDFRLGLANRLGLMFTGSYSEGQEDSAYLDFVDGFGDEIFHATTVEVASATVGLVFDLAPSGWPVVPYVGAGGGLYAWRLEESGDFIDFDLVDAEIFTDTFEDSGTAAGWYALVGIEVPVGTQLAFFAEGRWQSVEEELSDDFEGLGDIDLSGRHLAAGVAWRF